MPRKKRVRETIEITHEGRLVRGERVIEGTRTLGQYIIYEGRCLPDLHGYRPDERNTYMANIARQMLGELVSGGTVSAQPAAKFGL